LLVAAAVPVVLVLPSSAVAQGQAQPSLAELARQEAARRKTAKENKKVITTKDLPESARRPAAAAAPADSGASGQSAGEAKPATDAAAGSAASSAGASGDDRGEAFWQGRISQAREGLRRNEIVLEALQARVNGLTMDYDRHDPFERNTIGDSRKKALEEIERVKAEIEQSRKQIAAIEEEARKAGVPPGWLR
jgi:hypothetical protein